MPRVAIAGFQHETNSFSDVSASLAAFQMADSWPGLLVGDAVIEGTRGMNLPIAGFAAEAAGMPGIDLVSILWCAAEPSGPVTAEAFDTITGRIADGLRAAGPLDGIYLDLHGAMISDNATDGETEILRRVRAVAPDTPLVISLDMHANLSARTVELTDAICMFRTYPHLDMAAVGVRSAVRLGEMLRGRRWASAHRSLPFLIPLHAQATDAEPARGLYASLEDGPDGWQEFAIGFPAGDTRQTAPSVVAYAPDIAAAEARADALCRRAGAAEAAFAKPLLSAPEAVAQAMAAPNGRPVVIADVQDNPGGGGSSDTTGVLRALIAARAKGALLGVMADPETAAQAHAAGRGAVFNARIGGRGTPGDSPLETPVEVMALSDGRVIYEGAVYGGAIGQMGPSALLRIVVLGCEVEVVVSSIRNQCLDRAYFRHIGRPPEAARILAVKSTVHFRADFAPISQAILPCAAAGALSGDLASVRYRHLNAGLRLGPMGPTFLPGCEDQSAPACENC